MRINREGGECKREWADFRDVGARPGGRRGRPGTNRDSLRSATGWGFRGVRMKAAWRVCVPGNALRRDIEEGSRARRGGLCTTTYTRVRVFRNVGYL